jgi:hypothetical protein
MGRAGFQHRGDDGSDTNGFQPGGSGDTEVHNTTYTYADRYTGTYLDTNPFTYCDPSTSHTHPYLVFSISEDAPAYRYTYSASESPKQQNS